MSNFVCAQCRQPQSENDAFCRACGARSAGEAPSPTITASAKSSPPRRVFIGNSRHPLFWPALVTALLVIPFVGSQIASFYHGVHSGYRDEIDEEAPTGKQATSPKSPANAAKQPAPAAKKTSVTPRAAPVEPSAPASEDASEHPAPAPPKPDPFAYSRSEPDANSPNHVTVVDGPLSNSETDEDALKRAVGVYSDLLAEMARINHDNEDAHAFAVAKAKTEKQYRKVINFSGFHTYYEETNTVVDYNGEDMKWSDGTLVRMISPKS